MPFPLFAILVLGSTTVDKTIASARDQLTWGTVYDPAYTRLKYPMGDVPKTKGVCSDVIVRSFRAAGYDLQKLVHEDMQKAWSVYPRYSGLNKPDKNIDHRRVKNLRVYFKRHGMVLSTAIKPGVWKPGDIVTWKLDNGLDHIGLLTNTKGKSGNWQVVHNIGDIAEEDCLASWKITGHYRFPRR